MSSSRSSSSSSMELTEDVKRIQAEAIAAAMAECERQVASAKKYSDDKLKEALKVDPKSYLSGLSNKPISSSEIDAACNRSLLEAQARVREVEAAAMARVAARSKLPK
eukprot:TRINITY_DN19323_c0_g1_i2.p1 TRINITY_DN19323_c0_g1~~TRINITY_DN19323_c0_g1_i2.p1  ORF type:complete len:108 (+),score=27.01 TRINITY_DN19323_c0_g1_i2:41-364(+)